MKSRFSTPRSLALQEALRDLIRAAERAKRKRLPVAIRRAIANAIDHVFHAINAGRRRAQRSRRAD